MPSFPSSCAQSARTIFTDVSIRDCLKSAGFDVVKETPRFLPLTIKSRCGSLSYPVVSETALATAGCSDVRFGGAAERVSAEVRRVMDRLTKR
jgi:hypothetical protein